MTTLPPPPVPQALREILQNYPAHIERLQEVLNRITAKRLPGVDPFERATWLIEGRLDAFVSEARKELKEAEAFDDFQLIAQADQKLKLMLKARSSNGGMKNLRDLWSYFETHKEELQ
jgi:hypothetical protein